MPARLTDRLLSGLALPEGRKDMLLFDSAVPGLGVRITPKGKHFLCQWTDKAGRKVREPLGAYGNITIDQAREAARVMLGRVAAGVDVRAERLAVRAEAERAKAESYLTLDQLVTDWTKLHLAHRRPKYAYEAERAMRYSLADLLDKPAARISRADAVDALDAIAKSGRVAMAGRTMAYARASYRWAMRRGLLDSNPFADLPIPAGALQRERALDDDEMRAVWQAMRAMDYPFGPLFRLMALTLVREQEAAGARWSEFDTDRTLWTVPAARAKLGRAAHLVAATEPVRELLASIPRIDGQDLIFSTTGTTPASGFSKAKARLDKLSGVTGWRLHDLRRTGVSKLAELGVDPVSADRLLDHQPHKLSAVARIYQRYDFAEEQRKALALWADWLTGNTPTRDRFTAALG